MYQQAAEKKDVDIFAILEQRNKDRDREDRQRRGILMEPKYYEEDYEKLYEKSDDLSRIVRGTFDVSRYFQEGEFFAQGPWRVEALREAYKISELKTFVEQFARKGLDYVCTHKTDNEDFEKIAESCRKKWNDWVGNSKPIETYEQAFLRALSIGEKIASPSSAPRDPFRNRRVEVLFDEKNNVYLVKRTLDMRPFQNSLGGGFYLVVMDTDGQVLVLPGAFRQ